MSLLNAKVMYVEEIKSLLKLEGVKSLLECVLKKFSEFEFSNIPTIYLKALVWEKLSSLMVS